MVCIKGILPPALTGIHFFQPDCLRSPLQQSVVAWSLKSEKRKQNRRESKPLRLLQCKYWYLTKGIKTEWTVWEWRIGHVKWSNKAAVQDKGLTGKPHNLLRTRGSHTSEALQRDACDFSSQHSSLCGSASHTTVILMGGMSVLAKKFVNLYSWQYGQCMLPKVSAWFNRQ